MKEIVKYHNDFNKIKLPSFKEQEQNLLFGILAKIKLSPKNEFIDLYPEDLREFVTENLTNQSLKLMLIELKNKFFKADFTILLDDPENNRIGISTINLFTDFTIWATKDKEEKFLNIDYSSKLEKITFGINPRFAYLVNNLTKNFTAFELSEFIAISGKYTKTLYRLLKQYKQTGYLKMGWQEFLEVMDIPQTYEMRDIEKQILKPALKELTKPRNLFDQIRVPFEALQYTKIKGRGRGRGGKVIGIEFSFKPQMLKESIQNPQEPNNKITELINPAIKKPNSTQNVESKINFQAYEGIKLSESFYNIQSIKKYIDNLTQINIKQDLFFNIESVCPLDDGTIKVKFSIYNPTRKNTTLSITFDNIQQLESVIKQHN